MSLSSSGAALVRLACLLAFAAMPVVSGACHNVVPARPAPKSAMRQFPGVDIVSTSAGGFYVHIMSGLTSNGDPLYIIDGTPMTIDPNRGIDWVDRDDIVAIRVLKDPAETAVYGPRGRNGVIILTSRLAARRRRQ